MFAYYTLKLIIMATIEHIIILKYTLCLNMYMYSSATYTSKQYLLSLN